MRVPVASQSHPHWYHHALKFQPFQWMCVVLLCVSLMPNDVEHVFMCLLYRKYCLQVCDYFLFFINLFIYFIFGCVGSSLLHMGFLQLRRMGVTLCCSVWASHCGGFSFCRAWALGMWASVVVALRLNSCGTQAQLLRGMWDLPGPGLKPVSPALAGGFLTTAPPGKSQQSPFFSFFIVHVFVSQLRNFCLSQDFKDFSPIYSSTSFILRDMIHFDHIP